MGTLFNYMQEEDTSNGEVSMESIEVLDALVSGASAEIEVSSMEGAKISDDIDELERICASLEELTVIAKDSLEEGGLERTAARIMKSYSGYHYERLGIDEEMPSMESFGGDSTRSSSTTISMEGIKEVVDKVIKAISTAWNAMVRWIKDTTYKFFNAVPRIKKSAEGLKAKVEKLSGAAKESKVKLGKHADRLSIGGSVPSLSNVMSKMETLAKEVADVKGSDAFSKAYADNVGKIKFTDNKQDFLDGVEAMVTAMDKAMGSGPAGAVLTKSLDNKRFPGMTGVQSDELPGNQMLYAGMKELTGDPSDPESVRQAVSAMGSLKIKLVPFNPAVGKVKSDEISTLSLSDITTNLNSIMKVCDTLMTFQKRIGGLEKTGRATIEAGKKFAKDNSKGEHAEKFSGLVQALAALSRPVAEATTQPFPVINNYIGKTLGAVYGACSMSASQYSKA